MAQQSQQQSDNSFDGLMIIGGIIIIFVLIWFFAKEEILNITFAYWKMQLMFIGILSKHLDGFSNTLATVDHRNVTWEMFYFIGTAIAKYSRWVITPALVYLAYFVYSKSASEQLKRNMSIDQLADSEAKIWPQIKPLTALKLSKVDQDTGPWASAMTPRQLARKKELILEDGSLDRDKAAIAFASQLDVPLTKLSKMNVQRKAAFALFAARISEDEESYKKMIRILAESTAAGKTDFSCIKDTLRKFGKGQNEKIAKIVAAHAYELTMLTSLLQVARGSGILNDTDFLGWMKPQDRALWYAMNQNGRRVAWAEGAGVKAHWLAEVILNRRIDDPMIDSAVDALEESLKETKDIDPNAQFKYRF